MHDYHDVLYRIQKEVGQWAKEQFGENVSKWTGQTLGSLLPLLGMMEEVGELCHATGYRHSGRGFTTEEEYLDAIKDGLADILVFTCDYASREGIVLIDVLEEVWNKVKKRRQAKWLDDKAKESPKPGEPLFLQAGEPTTFRDVTNEVSAQRVQSIYEQTGQGFAEPPEEDNRRLGGCDCHGATFCPDQEFSHYEGDVPVFKSKTSLPRPIENQVDPSYIYGKSREVRPEEEDKQPEDGWAVARKIAKSFVDGQNQIYALKSIDSFEKQYNESKTV